jgi:CRISPR-associated protein Csm4
MGEWRLTVITYHTYRLTLELRAPSGSSWQADTIFGHLCWLLYWRHGKTRLDEWRERYRADDPPFILSDGFPGPLLPRPLPLPDTDRPKSKQEGLAKTFQLKQQKQIAWLMPTEFEQVRSGQPLETTEKGDAARKHFREWQESPVTFKNQISRLTGTTGEEGQLYPFVEQARWKKVTIYVRIAEGELETVTDLFAAFQAEGYGKRKSIGYGEIVDCKGWDAEFTGFNSFDGANAFVSLSHFVPAPTDPTNGQWKINVKYGKLGGEWATAANPFKHPLLMLTPGSWFRTEQPIKDWYGRIVENISPQYPGEVVQYGLAFAVPMRVI